MSVRLAECGLLSAGDPSASALAALHAPNECYRACLSSASCDDLQALLCGASIELARACDERCAYHCGDGVLIAHENLCDGVAQCGSGEDEAGCPMWRCRDGAAEIPLASVCNFVRDCDDGSDETEAQCAFCRTSEGRPLRRGGVALCDGIAACADGADEIDCERFECAEGSSVVLPPGQSPRCDGWSQCSDGSDETGCATLTLTCG